MMNRTYIMANRFFDRITLVIDVCGVPNSENLFIEINCVNEVCQINFLLYKDDFHQQDEPKWSKRSK